MAETLCFKPYGRGFDPYVIALFSSLLRIMALVSTRLLTEMSI
jgi:hypothetical protein